MSCWAGKERKKEMISLVSDSGCSLFAPLLGRDNWDELLRCLALRSPFNTMTGYMLVYAAMHFTGCCQPACRVSSELR